MAEGGYRAGAIGHTGAGGFGHGLHRAFRAVAGVEMIAVADPDPAGRARAQAEAEALRGYADYRDMLAREELDLVSVGPRWLDQRLEMVLACIDAGCHVYCEKPLAISLEDGDRMRMATAWSLPPRRRGSRSPSGTFTAPTCRVPTASRR